MRMVEAAFRVWEGVLSRAECRQVIDAIAKTTPSAGMVLRGSRDRLDPRVRLCSEHTLAPAAAAIVVAAMRRVGGLTVTARHRLDGPKFVSYRPGQYFRAHRDRSSDPADPPSVRDRRVSLVCLLNDAEPDGGLPVFDGGTLVLHVPGPAGVRPTNLKPGAGCVIAFDSGLLHEVRPVRDGVRYSAVGWLYTSGGLDDRHA
jgi:predicted 2-oxoglutarate/Fe(II)-dependent dioxygenase YbiX